MRFDTPLCFHGNDLPIPPVVFVIHHFTSRGLGNELGALQEFHTCKFIKCNFLHDQPLILKSFYSGWSGSQLVDTCCWLTSSNNQVACWNCWSSCLVQMWRGHAAIMWKECGLLGSALWSARREDGARCLESPDGPRQTAWLFNAVAKKVKKQTKKPPTL